MPRALLRLRLPPAGRPRQPTLPSPAACFSGRSRRRPAQTPGPSQDLSRGAAPGCLLAFWASAPRSPLPRPTCASTSSSTAPLSTSRHCPSRCPTRCPSACWETRGRRALPAVLRGGLGGRGSQALRQASCCGLLRAKSPCCCGSLDWPRCESVTQWLALRPSSLAAGMGRHHLPEPRRPLPPVPRQQGAPCRPPGRRHALPRDPWPHPRGCSTPHPRGCSTRRTARQPHRHAHTPLAVSCVCVCRARCSCWKRRSPQKTGC